jgi:hypothetical protein
MGRGMNEREEQQGGLNSPEQLVQLLLELFEEEGMGYGNEQSKQHAKKDPTGPKIASYCLCCHASKTSNGRGGSRGMLC